MPRSEQKNAHENRKCTYIQNVWEAHQTQSIQQIRFCAYAICTRVIDIIMAVNLFMYNAALLLNEQS